MNISLNTYILAACFCVVSSMTFATPTCCRNCGGISSRNNSVERVIPSCCKDCADHALAIASHDIGNLKKNKSLIYTVGASAKNYDRIQEETQFIVQIPSIYQAYSVQFVPVQGQLRNQRVEVALVNDTQGADSQQRVTLYRKLVCKTMVEWEYVDTVQVPKTSKEIIVTLKPDGTVVVGDQVILMGERYLW